MIDPLSKPVTVPYEVSTAEAIARFGNNWQRPGEPRFEHKFHFKGADDRHDSVLSSLLFCHDAAILPSLEELASKFHGTETGRFSSGFRGGLSIDNEDRNAIIEEARAYTERVDARLKELAEKREKGYKMAQYEMSVAFDEARQLEYVKAHAPALLSPGSPDSDLESRMELAIEHAKSLYRRLHPVPERPKTGEEEKAELLAEEACGIDAAVRFAQHAQRVPERGPVFVKVNGIDYRVTCEVDPPATPTAEAQSSVDETTKK